jgi:hypothetical protein
MTPLRSMPVLLAVFLLVLLSGCARKKPVLVMPQQTPPTAAPTPSPTPATAETQTQTPAPEAQATPQPSPSPETAKTEPEKTAAKKHHPKHNGGKKPSPLVGEKPGTETARVTRPVIENAPTPQPAPVTPTPELTQEQASTEQLIKNTEAALNGIKRQLSQDEQNVAAQIRDFIAQSRKATNDRDFTSAHKFALKANLLSNELARAR